MLKVGNLIIKNDQAEKPMLVYGEVYLAGCLDTDSDAMSFSEIEKTAHDFLRSGRIDKIDVDHDLTESGCCVVESFVVRHENPDFKTGSWVIGVEITDPTLKEAVRKGDLNGYSFYSDDLYEVTVENLPIKLVRKLAGTVEMSTEPSIEEHDHEAIVELDEDAMVVPCFTSQSLNHRHPIRRTTATEIEAGHAHRMIY